MLACSVAPFDSQDYIFEIKWDGMKVHPLYRERRCASSESKFKRLTRRYPELSTLAGKIRADQAVLDGELVVLSGDKPDFYKLQKRWGL